MGERRVRKGDITSDGLIRRDTNADTPKLGEKQTYWKGKKEMETHTWVDPNLVSENG